MSADLSPGKEYVHERISARGLMDGSESLSQAAARLRAYADDLERREREGWILRGGVRSDYGSIYHEVPSDHLASAAGNG